MGSETRSQAQNLEKPLILSRGHNIDAILIKLYQAVIFMKSRPNLKQGGGRSTPLS